MKINPWYLLGAVGVATLLACGGNTQGSGNGGASPAPGGGPSGSYVEPAPTATAPEPEITLAEFDKVLKGMSYEQAVEIIGKHGTVSSEYQASDPQYSDKTYVWHGEGSFAEARFNFNGFNKLERKSQNGLK